MGESKDFWEKLFHKVFKLKQKKNTTEGAKLYREANQQGVRKAKETGLKNNAKVSKKKKKLQKNNSKKAYQRVKELASSKQWTTTIQDKAGKSPTEEQDNLKRWTEYCSKLYTYTTTGDPKVLYVPPPVNNDSYPILQEEAEAAVKSLKEGKSAGVDNIPSELVQAGGETWSEP